MDVTRRDVLRVGVATGAGLLASRSALGLRLLQPVVGVDNPLASYPNRGWEKIYRDQYHYDRSFTWVCGPNDTHMCRLRAFVRNGIVIRNEQEYTYDQYGDLYGNKASVNWNPRGCPKGYTFQRRVYGPYRLKGPVVRKGWKEWADAGFPPLSDRPELRSRYRFDDRGNDQYVRLSWDDAFRYAAEGLAALAQTYSGDAGKRRLLKDGYDPLMLTHWHGAGTRTLKFGSNLPIHGVIGKFGIYRFSNMTGLLDHHVRGVPADRALGARDWNEYTWRGDQAPGHPFVHGLQTSDCDFNDLRFAKLHIQVGKNLIENKMPDSHWMTEIMERGGKVVVIAPEYNAPATKCDVWIPVRPGLSDTAIFLGVSKVIMDQGWYDEPFVKQFTDLPYLVRTDTLRRLRAHEVFTNYHGRLKPDGPSFTLQGLTPEQYDKIGDFVVFDAKSRSPKAVTRDDVGGKLAASGLDPDLEWTGRLKLVDGKEVEVMTIWSMYKRHLRDYDLDTVEGISGARKDVVQQLAHDLATLKPAAIHFGEGINHYFHATLHNRATFLPLMLTGNIGRHGAGVFAWAGNYKGALLQASPWTGPGVGAYIHEDPFHPVLDEGTRMTHKHLRHTTQGEEPSYWGHGEKILAVDTPEGRKVFTGSTHLPCPTKSIWYNNANFINQAKWVYNLIQNVLPKIDMIVDQQVEWTGSAEYADLILPANSWIEFEQPECAGSCSNPFIQVWGGEGIAPLYDSKDDAAIFAGVAEALSKKYRDARFRDYWKFVLEKKPTVYLQRVFDSATTTRNRRGSYQVDKLLKGGYGAPGTALMLFRTYPRVPFWEQIHDDVPFYTDTGRLHAYCDLPEAIEYGENLIVHREGPEATPYLPNVIVSTSPFVRPHDYSIPLDAMDADQRAVRNVKMPWSEVRKTVNPLWAQGYRFFCSTPKSRHSTHSSWSTVDWNWLWSCNFADPYRRDKRAPGVADRQIQMNPRAATDLGLHDGDYVYVDANPADRPYVGWKPSDPRYRAFRCMVRVKFNPALPYSFTILKHTGWIATERSVRAHESRPDGRALVAETGYQASYRYGSQQSITRGWLPPMHQTDTLFHKKTGAMGFVFGFEVDNHAVNTVPKETLVRITKAEAGGIGGKGTWEPRQTGLHPGTENDFMQRYLKGDLLKVEEA
ncbi:MAG: molybdopterin-dependent oxidoreductase [Candidatus Binatia bacterium]